MARLTAALSAAEADKRELEGMQWELHAAVDAAVSEKGRLEVELGQLQGALEVAEREKETLQGRLQARVSGFLLRGKPPPLPGWLGSGASICLPPRVGARLVLLAELDSHESWIMYGSTSMTHAWLTVCYCLTTAPGVMGPGRARIHPGGHEVSGAMRPDGAPGGSCRQGARALVQPSALGPCMLW